MMKAVLCEKFGPPSSLRYADVPEPKAGDNEVVVAVHACGVNFPDTLIIQGKYQFKPPFPFSPGAEITGIITEIGKNVKNYKIGQKVIGILGWGGFSEKIVVSPKILMPLPEKMDFVVGSGFAMTYGTSLYALKDCAKINVGETVLILGASGGVGLAAVEIAKLFGAKVIAVASSEEKLETCKKFGADFLINYSEKDWPEKIKALGENIDVVYDPVGGNFSEKALRLISVGGRYLVVGFAAGEIPNIPLNLCLLKCCSIVGVFWGRWVSLNPDLHVANLTLLSKWHAEGKLKPLVSATYPLEEAYKALEDISQRKVHGKVVVTTRNYSPKGGKSKL